MSERLTLPDVWPTEPLGRLCYIVIGTTPSRKRPEYWGGELPWLSIGDMNQGCTITTTKEGITRLGAEESRCRLIPAGTVLLSFKLSIGKVAVSSIDTYTNEAIAALPIKDRERLHRGFLAWTLRTIRLDDEVDVAAKGVTLNKGKLQRLRIPLPPFDEQRRIATVLDKADALRRQRRQALEFTDKLIQSIFLEMFVRNEKSKSWKPSTVESLADSRKGSIRTGPFGSQLLHSEFVDDGISVLGIDNAVSNRFEWGQRRYVTPEKYDTLRRYKVFPGDVIITIMGTCGRCAVVPEDVPEAINTKHLCCITLDQRKCLPEFLHACFLYHPEILWQLGVRTKGAVMPGLNMGIIKGLSLRVPPLELQKEFREATTKASSVVAQEEESVRELDCFFSSLQQRAFRGELDLTRVVLSSVAASGDPEDSRPVTQRASSTARQLSFPTPVAIERELRELERRAKRGEAIPWSQDYFVYRIMALQPPPFAFGDLLRTAETIFDAPPPYTEIRDIVFAFLEDGERNVKLAQEFDDHRKEIVLRPCP